MDPDMKQKVEEWAETLKFKGKIPNSFKNVCNPSTQFIWEQLIQKVKPKADITHARRNIILNQHLAPGSDPPSAAETPVREVAARERARDLRREVNALETAVAEKVLTVGDLDKSVDFDLALGKRVSESALENRKRTFLYRKKAESLEAETAAVHTEVEFIESITPREMDRADEEVSETLRNCAEKIKQSLTKGTLFNDSKTSASTSASESVLPQPDVEVEEAVRRVACEKNFIETVPYFAETIGKLNSDLSDLLMQQTATLPKAATTQLLNKLYAIDIENKLSAMKFQKEIEVAGSESRVKLNSIREEIGRQNPEVRDVLELMLKDFVITKKLEIMTKLLSMIDDHLIDESSITDRLEKVQRQNVEIHKNMMDRLREITAAVSDLERVRSRIESLRTEGAARLELLDSYTAGAALARLGPLREAANAREARAFASHPLGRARPEAALDVSEPDPAALGALRAAVGRLREPGEAALLRALRERVALAELRERAAASGISELERGLSFVEHSLEDLEKSEQQTNRTLSQLETVNKMIAATTSVYSTTQIQTVMNAWLEGALKGFVPSDRQLDDQPFEYYQKLYDNLYDKLQK